MFENIADTAYVELPLRGANPLDDGGVARQLGAETFYRDGPHSKYIGATAPLPRELGADQQAPDGFAGVVVLPRGLRLFRAYPAGGVVTYEGRVTCTAGEAAALVALVGATLP